MIILIVTEPSKLDEALMESSGIPQEKLYAVKTSIQSFQRLN